MKKILSIVLSISLFLTAFISLPGVYAEMQDSGIETVLTMTDGSEKTIKNTVNLSKDSYKLKNAEELELKVYGQNVLQVTLDGNGSGNSDYVSVSFPIPNTSEEAFLVGLTTENANEVQSKLISAYTKDNSFQIDDLSFIDAEKTGNSDEDDQLCWAATASNILTLTGWAKKAGFESEDDLFETFIENYSNNPGNVFYGLAWFFNGVGLAASGDERFAQIKNYPNSGAYLKDYAYNMFCDIKYIDEYTKFSQAISDLSSGYGIGLGINMYNTMGLEIGNHAITMLGYVVDKSYSTSDVNYYKYVLVSDSDSDKLLDKDRRQSKNIMTAYNFKSFQNKNKTVLGFQYGSAPMIINSYQSVAPYTSDFGKETSSKATKNLRTTTDVAISNIYIGNTPGNKNHDNRFKDSDTIYLTPVFMNDSDVIVPDNSEYDFEFELLDKTNKSVVKQNAKVSFDNLNVFNMVTFTSEDYVELSDLSVGDYTAICKISPPEGMKEAYLVNNTFKYNFSVIDHRVGEIEDLITEGKSISDDSSSNAYAWLTKVLNLNNKYPTSFVYSKIKSEVERAQGFSNISDINCKNKILGYLECLIDEVNNNELKTISELINEGNSIFDDTSPSAYKWLVDVLKINEKYNDSSVYSKIKSEVERAQGFSNISDINCKNKILGYLTVLKDEIGESGPVETPTEAPQKTTVTIYGFNGESKTKEFNVGDTFTVYNTLNTSAYGGKISNFGANQTYTNGLLELTDEYDVESGFENLDDVFPITKSATFSTVKPKSSDNQELGIINYNVTTSKSYQFDDDKDVMIKTTYKVTNPGNAEIRNNLITVTLANDDLTKIVQNGQIVKKYENFRQQAVYTLDEPATEPATEAPTEVPTEAPTEAPTETPTEAPHVHTPADPVRENEHAATCVKKGSYDEVVYCSVCKNEISRINKEIAIDNNAHTPSNSVRENEEPATCSQKGSYYEVVYCKDCSKELSREKKDIEKLPHTHVTINENIKDVSCTENGEYYKIDKCSVCNEEFSRERITVTAPGHDLQFIKEVPATYDGDGIKAHYKCSRCNKLFSDAAGTIEITENDIVISKLTPTEAPTAPVENPTEAPTDEPTIVPTEAPTEEPTQASTEAPTEPATEMPTELPTERPTEKTQNDPTEPVAPATPDESSPKQDDTHSSDSTDKATPDEVKSDWPKTGANTQIPIWVIITIISLVGVVGTPVGYYLQRKKRKGFRK